jgi:hypothetical protein
VPLRFGRPLTIRGDGRKYGVAGGGFGQLNALRG